MINVTVKTLDSQNHHFNVDDSFTVEQFKNHIADEVNVPAARQRIIYCGRVLQDSSKLIDYDVDGKVVHLVQRAPPNSNTRNVRSLTPPPDLNRARGGFRGFDRVGNTVYMGMGSMTLPQGLMDPQQMIPPRATHTLSSSRLNVARRMLRNAENVIRQLENPSNGNESAAEEQAEEEMTPVIEARVIVPSGGHQMIDGNAILNAVQNTIFPVVSNINPRVGPSTSSTMETPSGQESSGTPPEASPRRSSSAENLNADTSNGTPRVTSRPSRLRCRGTEMAALLTTLNQLQFRFAPFLARYQTFMQDDPQVPPENVQETRQMLNRVSQVMHFLGHAYHSLSDIIINVDDVPPRLLLCRPILIQPPAVVQTGIPIQVEAQINLSADRPGPTTNTAAAADRTGTPTTAAPNTNVTEGRSGETLTNAPLNGQPPRPQPNVSLQPGFVGLPFMPTGSMRVITTPVEIRTLRSNASGIRPTNNNNNASTSASFAAPNMPNAPQPAPPTPETNRPEQHAPPAGQPGSNNDNLEFFMEVTPEALRGGNLIQSIIQLVGSQLGDTITQAHHHHRSENSSQSNQPGNIQGQSQQSQARSTQTNPTTATHTRSTSRPHVHMTQQSVQGGFDPFLHCYSHHISQARPQQIVSIETPINQEPAAGRAPANAPSAPPNAQASGTGPPPNLANIAAHFQDIMREWRPHMNEFPPVFDNHQTTQMMASAVADAFRQRQQQATAAPPRGAPDGEGPLNQGEAQARPQQDIFSFISRLMEQNLPDLLGNGPTLDVYAQSFHPEPYVQGESLIIDLIMLMLRNLRINDLFVISSGNMAPLQRQINTIQRFFLTEVCQNDTTDAGIARATERIMVDFMPIITALESVPSRENIDMVRTIEGFFRQRLPDIIRLTVNSGSRMEGNTGPSASNLLTTIGRAGRELLALTIHCSANGQQGVESVCEQVLFSTIFNQSNVPNDIHHWTITSSRTALRTIFQNLEVRASDVEQYVVRRAPEDPLRPTAAQNNAQYQEENSEAIGQNSVESMEVDYVASPTSADPLLAAAPIRVENTEPLPNVIWGSESWHRQTPEEWVPIITRDIQKQRKQNIQPPFSDAYLSGMPSKRRKVINNSKPQGSLPQVISESIRQAVTSTGLTSAAPLEIVTQAASDSTEIQTAYRSLLQSTVRSNLRNNEDFNPERYPNTVHYFEESSAE